MKSQTNDLSPGEKPNGFSSGPPAGGRGVVTKQLSNLDRSGFRVVSKGDVVSCLGLHYVVTRVRMGQWYGHRTPGYGANTTQRSSAPTANAYVVKPK